jgi:hypothetical protein
MLRQLTQKEDSDLQKEARKILQILYVDKNIYISGFDSEVAKIYDDEIKRRNLIPFDYKSLPDYLGMSIDRRNKKINELNKMKNGVTDLYIANRIDDKINELKNEIKAYIR